MAFYNQGWPGGRREVAVTECELSCIDSAAVISTLEIHALLLLCVEFHYL